jgi:ABC-type nitrate/sulfonate/bicarbonate transport system substrate-binding protein
MRQKLTFAYKKSLLECLKDGDNTWELIAVYYDDDDDNDDDKEDESKLQSSDLIISKRT